MGLISILLDTLVVTTACAGLRRATGISIHQKMNKYVNNPTARSATSMFFNVGEYVCDRGINAFQDTKPTNKDDETKTKQ